MNEHTWKVGDHLEIRAGDRIITGYDGKRTAGPALLEPFIVEEILRLAEREQDLLRQWATHRASLRDIMGLPAEAIDPVSVLEEILRLAEENASLKATVDPLISGIATLEAQLAEVREEALRLERENRDLKEALPVFTANSPADQEKARILTEIFKVAAMRGDPVASLLQRISDLEAENTALADECVKLARERDRLTVERDGWKAEAQRLAAEIRAREEREEAPKNLATFFTYVEQANRILALEADNERLLADLALAVRKRPMPLSDGPPGLPLEREAFFAETPEDQWLLYREAAGWASAAREFELEVERLQAESTTLKAKLDAIRSAAEASPHDCSLRQDVFFLLSVPNEGEPVLPKGA